MFRKQQPVGPYIVDFVCNSKKLIIEVDGGHHAEEQEYDAERTQFLENAGYKVLRFWNNEILENIEGVAEIILKSLNERPDIKEVTTPPHPPRKRWGRKDMLYIGSIISTWVP